MRLRLAATCIAGAAAACLSRPSPIGGGGGGGGGSDGGGPIDGSVTSSDATTGSVSYMFTTSHDFHGPWATGNPESGSADAACTELASVTRYAGQYMAWLSYSDNNNVVDRLREVSPLGNWHTTHGDLFAVSVQDLVNGAILVAPNYDETGTMIGSGSYVATGTAPDGFADGGTAADCPSGSIEVGDPTSKGGTWTADGEDACSILTLRLYCFQYAPAQ